MQSIFKRQEEMKEILLLEYLLFPLLSVVKINSLISAINHKIWEYLQREKKLMGDPSSSSFQIDKLFHFHFR